MKFYLLALLALVGCQPDDREDKPHTVKVQVPEPPEVQAPLTNIDCEFQRQFVDAYLARYAPSFRSENTRCQSYGKNENIVLAGYVEDGLPCRSEVCWLYTFTVTDGQRALLLAASLASTEGRTKGMIVALGENAPTMLLDTEMAEGAYNANVQNWSDPYLPLMYLTYRSLILKLQ